MIQNAQRVSCKFPIAFYDRFRLAHSLTVLEEAITLSREALKLCPSGHPDRPSSLHKLARCILDRFIRKRTSLDPEEAIKFGRDALVLCPPSHPDRSASLHTLARCLCEQFHKEERKESGGNDYAGMRGVGAPSTGTSRSFMGPPLPRRLPFSPV